MSGSSEARARFAAAIDADPAREEVFSAWQAAQELPSVYHHGNLGAGRQIAEKVVTSFHTCPNSEIARLGRTLRR